MKRRLGFSLPDSVAHECFGPAAFWAELRELRASIRPPRAHFTWEEWDSFFESAQRHGMMNYVPRTGNFDPQDGEAEAWGYGAIGMGLARQFLRVKQSRESGIDAYRFHLQEQKVIEADERRRKNAVDRERQARVERNKREEEARKNKGGTRHFTPRAIREDDEVAI